MASPDQASHTGLILTTALASLISGYMLAIFTTRGYIISPSLVEERRRYRNDPVESEESDVDEDDTLLDHAPNWANGEEADRRQGLKVAGPETKKTKTKKKATATPAAAPAASPAAATDNNEECKLVLVVRTDLGMTKGKIAAQCSHATLACYKALCRAGPTSPEAKLLARWERRGQAKIAVQVKSQEEMLELRRKARALGLTAEVIQDAGRTQIDPGSLTVLGVGPAPKSLVDQVTGGLKLL